MEFIEKLNALHKEWKGRLGTDYTFDGVMYHEGETEEETVRKWFDSPKRVAILLKDQHQFNKNGETWDEPINLWFKNVKEDANWKPEEVAHWNNGAAANRELKSRFVKNIACIVWGLTKIEKGAEWTYADVTANIEEVKKYVNTQPFALVECKKYPGGPACSNTILIQHLNNYGDLLKRELELLNPNMIVCTSGIIYERVLKMYPEDELVAIPEHNHVTYHQKSGTLIFCSYHPSARKSNATIYEYVMTLYRAFLNWLSK